MVTYQPALKSLLQRLQSSPFQQDQLNTLVKETLEISKTHSSPENRKAQWEYLLRSEVFSLAATEGKALADEDAAYYNKLRDMLDVILSFTEHDACEQTFPLNVLQDLLETQTVASCSHIFSWIELRSNRLTDGMVPQKGKALVLLRTLNDLLRRLSKMGSTTIFCGRILTFLSGVFPLGERSGVNLRGEYGPIWEGVGDLDKKERPRKEGEGRLSDTGAADKSDEQIDKMQVDSKDAQAAKSTFFSKDDFYRTFWSLQLPFSKPPLFAQKDIFPEFKGAVNKVLPVIKEATAKERAMMGSRAGPGASASLKRKREPETEETSYFFAKFLTSPDLLDLEIADTHFRRQFLFQLLILLHHLLTFTKTNKSSWSSTRNRSLQMDFTLETADAQWVQDTINKAMEELRQTTPNGRAFADTVNAILDRDKNWVRWKNELCAPFDKEPWSTELEGKKVGLVDATSDARLKMREPPDDWPWALGSEPLSDIWDMGYRDLQDLQMPFQPGDVKDFVKKVKQEDARVAMRKKMLAKAAERVAQARAKAAAPVSALLAATETSSNSTEANETAGSTKLQEPTMATSEIQSQESIASQPSLHPSLPARPGLPSNVQKTETPLVVPNAQGSTPAPGPLPDPWAGDEQIAKSEENKQRWAWLALRTARDRHLQLFGRIGTGDIELLAQEIEKVHKNEETGSSGTQGGIEEGGVVKSGEGVVDVKMEETR